MTQACTGGGVLEGILCHQCVRSAQPVFGARGWCGHPGMSLVRASEHCVWARACKGHPKTTHARLSCWQIAGGFSSKWSGVGVTEWGGLLMSVPVSESSPLAV